MKRVAVIGLGRFGQHLARKLVEAGLEVLAIDREDRCVTVASSFVSLALAMDATDHKLLAREGLGRVDIAYITLRDFRSAALIVSALKDLGVGEVIARAVSAEEAKLLRRLGADEAVLPEVAFAEQLAERFCRPRE